MHPGGQATAARARCRAAAECAPCGRAVRGTSAADPRATNAATLTGSIITILYYSTVKFTNYHKRNITNKKNS